MFYLVILITIIKYKFLFINFFNIKLYIYEVIYYLFLLLFFIK